MSNTPFFEEILTSTAPKICVVAGPGSGKTKGVIVPKAKSLIEAGIDPSEILLLSFSRLSALDLRQKVSSLDQIPKASTVHSFCLAYLLSENDHGIRNRIETIALDFELEFLIDDLKVLFPSINKNDLRKSLRAFSAAWALSPHDEVFETDDSQRRFKAAVINWLSEHRCVLMEEIVYFAVDRLKQVGKSGFLENIKYILVDEYQDLNKLEQEFIAAFAEGTNLLVTVGDPDQSIYSFKFAWRDGIVDFYDREDVDSHQLPYCGRCPKKVLEVANKLLVQESPGRVKLPLPLDDREDGSVDLHAGFLSQDNEFRYVVDSIIGKLNEGVNPTDIIILIPKYKLGEEFAKYVAHNNIELPSDANFSLISKPNYSEVQRRAILMLSLLSNRESILHTRSYIGIGDNTGFGKEIKELKDHYGGWERTLEDADLNDFPAKKRRVRKVCQKIQDLKGELDRLTEMDTEEVIDAIFPIANEELSILNEVLKTNLTEDAQIKDVLNDLDEYSRSLPEDSGTVRIMTIMASKGLEAPHVYMIGCNDGNIPGKNRSEHLSDFEFQQEQRRLLYVGFTRAKDSLTVTWSQYIPFRQSKSHVTQNVAVRRINGQTMAKVGICSFLQDL